MIVNTPILDAYCSLNIFFRFKMFRADKILTTMRQYAFFGCLHISNQVKLYTKELSYMFYNFSCSFQFIMLADINPISRNRITDYFIT